MSRFDEFKTPESNDLLYTELDLNAVCEKCGLPVEKSWLSKNKKHLTHICPEGHQVSIEGNYNWLTRFLDEE